MKQRLKKLLSGFLCFALIASALVGALSASVLPAKAAYGVEKYTGDFYETILSYGVVDSGLESWFDWLAGVADYSNGNRDKFVCAFESDTFIQISVYIRPSTFELYSRQYVNVNDNYNGIGWNLSDWYETACTFVVLGNLRFNKTNNYLSYGHNDGYSQNQTVICMLRNQSFAYEDTYWFNNSSTNMAFPCRDLILNQNILVYCNRQIYKGADTSYGFEYSSNLIPGNAPVIVQEYHWFKFNLGDRWYITTYDQSFISNLEPGDDTFWVWSMYASKLSDPETPVFISIWWNDVQYLSFAETFITQTLTNVSVSGILAYDITDLILDPDYILLGIADFYQVIDTPGGMSLGNLMAESTDQIDLNLNAAEADQTHNEAWSEINNFIINYPTVSIVPEVLADQLSGNNAVGYGMGGVRAPNQIQQWMNQVYYDTDYFQYDLSIGGLDASYESIINFEILDTIIVPAQNVITSTSIRYWDHTYQLDNGTIDTYHIGNLDYNNPLFEQYDLILITKANAEFMGDTHVIYSLAGNGAQAYVGDIKRSDIAHDLYYESVYWILTNRAIEKSQLYVFCDSQSKLYKLLSDYINKRDLWDSSFFEFTMSLFWELETINGYLLRFEQEYKSWDLANKLSSIVTSLQEIADNTSETDVDPWYLALFNWIKAFEPSNFDFIGWVEEYDDFVDDLPDPGGATIIPFPTAAPTVLPTVAVAGG